MKTKVTTISDLATRFDFLMFGNRPDWDKNGNEIPPTGLAAKGFTIGQGRQLHWYLAPVAKLGKYRVWPQYDNGEIGRPRYIFPEQEITIHYKD